MTIRKMILFDVDGTLLATGGVGADALNHAFHEIFGIEEAWQDIIPDGKTDPVIIEEMAVQTLGRSLELSEYEQLCTLYLKHFEVKLKDAPRFRLMPGVTPLLEALAARGDILLGLATGNFESAAWMKVERGGIRHFFKFGGFGSDSRDRGELTRTGVLRGLEFLGEGFSTRDIFVVGDTLFDVHAARKAGVRSVAVTTGRFSAQDFNPLAPDGILADLSDARAFLKILES